MWLTDKMLGVAMLVMAAVGFAGLLAYTFRRPLMKIFGLTYWEVRFDDGPPVRFRKKPGIYEAIAACQRAKPER